jgi:hypothetical protein
MVGFVLAGSATEVSVMWLVAWLVGWLVRKQMFRKVENYLSIDCTTFVQTVVAGCTTYRSEYVSMLHTRMFLPGRSINRDEYVDCR